MSVAFKIKISDGSVVGPLDLEMVESWYEQGLIDRDTPVLPAGARTWKRFGDVVQVAPTAERRRAENHDDEDAPDATAGDPRRGRVAAALVLISGAIGAVLAWLVPGAWRPDLTPVPWWELGVTQVLLAMMALHTAEWTRRLTRAAVFLAAFAVFPLVGFAIAEGVPPDGLAVLGAVWLVTFGLFYLLAPSVRWAQLAACLAAVLLGGGGVVYFGVLMGGTAAVAALVP